MGVRLNFETYAHKAGIIAGIIALNGTIDNNLVENRPADLGNGGSPRSPVRRVQETLALLPTPNETI